MKHFQISIRLCATFALAGCATPSIEPALVQRIANSTPAVTVTARGETTPVGTPNADAADDPAIWRNAANPAASLIVGTDKKAGLYVYGLDGKTRDFLNAGRVNNVDLRDGVTINGQPGILVVASDRTDVANAKLALFRLDPSAAKLTALGKVDAGTGEAYGICMYRAPEATYAFIVLKDGTIHQVALDASGATPTGRTVRTMKLGTQSEGCAVDDRTGILYVAEEDVGLWRFDARATGATTPRRSLRRTARISSWMPRVSPSPPSARRTAMSSSPVRATMPMSPIACPTIAMSADSASLTARSAGRRKPTASN
jgi:3-phytase